MSRSIWKGPFVETSLLKKLSHRPTRLWSRCSTILPEFVGQTFLIHNGFRFLQINIQEDMIGHKFGEFSNTRKRAVYSKKAKKK